MNQEVLICVCEPTDNKHSFECIVINRYDCPQCGSPKGVPCKDELARVHPQRKISALQSTS